jgi:CheY-like chemotaxis protein
MMPEMDGFQVVAVLQMNTSWRDIPVVVVTALELTAEDRQPLNGGVKQILSKHAFPRRVDGAPRRPAGRGQEAPIDERGCDHPENVAEHADELALLKCRAGRSHRGPNTLRTSDCDIPNWRAISDGLMPALKAVPALYLSCGVILPRVDEPPLDLELSRRLSVKIAR